MTLISSVEHSKYVKISSGNYLRWAAWILEYEQYRYPDDVDMVSKLIIDNLEVKFCSPKHRELNMGNSLFGHCYHVTQAMYFFFKDADLKVMSAKCQGPAEQHWWLQDGNEIIDITTKKGINIYFKSIYGSPGEKTGHIKKIMKHKDYGKDEIIFVGDSDTDITAARENDIPIILRVHQFSNCKYDYNKLNKIDNLKGLFKIIKNSYKIQY